MAASHNIDLSYKDRATKVEYDIESIESLFTIVFMHDKAVTIVFFGDERYDEITNDELAASARACIHEVDDYSIFDGVESADELDYNVIRAYVGDEESIVNLTLMLNRFINCKPLPTDDGYGMSFVEYCGWNSARYDLPLMIITRLLANNMATKLTPRDIRRASDIIIEHDGSPWAFPYDLARATKGWGNISPDAYRLTMNTALYADGHIDWGSTAKLNDAQGEQKFPPGLKKEMARFGLDIVIDDLVAGENGRTVSKQDILDLIYYNTNDVYGTRRVGRNAVIRAKLGAHDTLNKLYPYTSPKSVPFNKLNRITPLARDCTEASLSGTILIGEKRIRPADNEAVQYFFPVPDNREGAEEGATRIVDLLEYMRDTEEHMHPYLYTFFDHFRGKDTRRGWDEFQVIRAQPITKAATMNAPYYRDGKPTDAYIRVSTGGAHGSIMAGLRNLDEEQVKTWIESDRGALDSEKPTLDLDNVLHLDWSSFYPQLATRLELYKTAENVDRYSDIINTRVKLKESIPFDRAEWTERDYKANTDQDALKVVLNAVTGAGNTHNPRAIIPLDNKTLSMRLMGNMHIWCLGQRLAQAGGLIVSTNTDGLYMTGLSIDEVQRVVDGYVHDYGMPVDPETVGRFINRDTSNRIEMLHGEIQQVRGRLRWGEQPYYVDDAIGKNVPYPLAPAHAVIRYITENRDWLTTDYDRDRLVSYINEIYEESTTPEAWYQVHVGSGSTRLTVDGVRQARINRVVMTKEGHGSQLGTERKAALRKDECHEVWNRLTEGQGIDQISDEMGLIWTEDTKGLDFSRLKFCRKIDNPELGKKTPEPIGLQPNSAFAEKKDFDEYWKDNKVACIAIPNPDDESGYTVPKVWRDSTLPHYTSQRGQTLNSTRELREFDMSKLDLDAYVAWAEKLLDGWKVTADLPAIGMVSRDDTVVPKSTRGPRVTKRSKAIDLVRWMYYASDTEGSEV